MSRKIRYFHISHGLRGCYMPDGEPYVIRAKTRRELKEAIQSEADMVDSGSTIGLSKRAIAQYAAELWRDAFRLKPYYSSLPVCLPTKEPGQSSYSYGIFVSHATRNDYNNQPEML